MNDRKGKKLITNGIVFAVLLIYLAVYFSVNSLWNVGTVFAIIIVAAIAVLQFFIYFGIFKNSKL